MYMHTKRATLLLSAAAIYSVRVGGAGDDTDPVFLDLRSFSLPSPSATGGVGVDLSVDLAKRTLDDLSESSPPSRGGGRRSRSSGSGARSRGQASHRFLTALASSESFARGAWRRRPVLIRSSEVQRAVGAAAGDGGGDHGDSDSDSKGSCWASGLFTLEDDLLPGLDGTFGIPAQRTGDAVRDGTRTETWSANRPLLETPRLLQRSDVESALQGGTVFLNFAGLAFPSLAALSTLSTSAFGLPTNVDVYATPPGIDVSIPPHTDRRDGLVVQTQGRKRWRVYAPPPPREQTSPDGLHRKPPPDPFVRGKDGDVITEEDLGGGTSGGGGGGGGAVLLDAILEPGDVMYLPAGFPHATDTATASTGRAGSGSGSGSGAGAGPTLAETSLHVTIGLDSNIWGLTYAHLRSMVLKRSGMASILGGSATVFDERAAGRAMETLPIGFLGPRGGDGESVVGYGNVADFICRGGQLRREGDGRRGGGAEEPLQAGTGRYVDAFVSELEKIMVALEPYRWIAGPDRSIADGGGGRTPVPGKQMGREDLPPRADFVDVAEFVLCRHLPAILDAQDGALAEVKPQDPTYVRKMRRYSQIQTEIMKKFSDFSDALTADHETSATADDKGRRVSSQQPTTAEGGWSFDKDDVIVAFLVLSAIVVGGPAVFDLLAESTRRNKKREDGGETKQKRA